MDPAPSQLSRFPEIVDRLFNAAAQGNLSPTECSALYQDIDNEVQSLQAQPDDRMRSICNDVIACFDKQGHNMQSLERLTNWLVKHTYKDSNGNYHGAHPAFQNLLNCISKIHHSVFESDAQEKSVSYPNQDPFEGEELALLEHVGGAAALELTKADPDSVILNIGHRWFDAAKRNLNTSERMQLYADTEKAIECFYDKKMKKFVLDQFYEHPIEDWKELAKWIEENTRFEYVMRKEIIERESHIKTQEVYDLNFTGAYHIFHQLVECFSEKKDLSESIFNDLNDDILRHFENSTMNISNTPTDVKKLVFSDVQQLQLMTMVSSGFEKLSKGTLMQYINESKITFSDLGLNTLDQIIKYFGSGCRELTKLNFKKSIPESILNINLSKIFPNISHLSLVDLTLPDDHLCVNNLPLKSLNFHLCRGLESLYFLKETPKLESLVLSYTPIENLEILSQSPLKHLELRMCPKLKNYEFLKDLKSLETVSIAYNDDVNINDLKFCPLLREIKIMFMQGVALDFLGECMALEVLHLQCVEGSDFLFLKTCPNLHTLKFYDVIHDSRFLFEIPSLRKLHVTKDSLAPEVIQSLQKNNIEVIIEII